MWYFFNSQLEYGGKLRTLIVARNCEHLEDQLTENGIEQARGLVENIQRQADGGNVLVLTSPLPKVAKSALQMAKYLGVWPQLHPEAEPGPADTLEELVDLVCSKRDEADVVVVIGNLRCSRDLGAAFRKKALAQKQAAAPRHPIAFGQIVDIVDCRTMA